MLRPAAHAGRIQPRQSSRQLPQPTHQPAQAARGGPADHLRVAVRVNRWPRLGCGCPASTHGRAAALGRGSPGAHGSGQAGGPGGVAARPRQHEARPSLVVLGTCPGAGAAAGARRRRGLWHRHGPTRARRPQPQREHSGFGPSAGASVL
jgi:hypothetical protein